MALDTRAKRASALGVGRPWLRGKDPDVTTGTVWRAASGLAYAGNALAAPVVAATFNRVVNLMGTLDTEIALCGTSDTEVGLRGTLDTVISLNGTVDS